MRGKINVPRACIYNARLFQGICTTNSQSESVISVSRKEKKKNISTNPSEFQRAVATPNSTTVSVLQVNTRQPSLLRRTGDRVGGDVVNALRERDSPAPCYALRFAIISNNWWWLVIINYNSW